MRRTFLSRRTFLRATGVSLALPLLDAMGPAFGQAAAKAAPPRRRLVVLNNGLSFHAPYFFPQKPGRDYAPSQYLEIIKELRGDFTVISGLSHPNMQGVNGHEAERSLLTGAPGAGFPGFRNTISFDQLAAERFAGETRFDSLVLRAGFAPLSWNRNGVPLPAADKPSVVFAKLFLKGSPKEVQLQARRLSEGKSILDFVQGQTNRLAQSLGARDRAKLDEYVSSVRECEQQLVKGQEWAQKEKPSVNVLPPQDIANPADVIGRTKLMYDLIHLALQTDSTRIVTFNVGTGGSVPPIAGVDRGYHELSHHGQEAAKLEQLRLIELEHMKAFGDFLAKLKGAREDGDTLLYRTMVLLSSNMGSASSHDTHNLPILLAGGGFKHGQYLAFDAKNNKPLCNLFVSMLQRLGLELSSFGSSTGTLAGLEV
jgi:hypothetical protein